MKVYVIKNDKGQYQTPDMDFIYSIWLADIFDDYEVAKCYCGSDCNVVECELIEKNELADHDKKVRAEVVAEIKQKAVHSHFGYMGKTEKGYYDIYAGILEDIEQGGEE